MSSKNFCMVSVRAAQHQHQAPPRHEKKRALAENSLQLKFQKEIPIAMDMRSKQRKSRRSFRQEHCLIECIKYSGYCNDLRIHSCTVL